MREERHRWVLGVDPGETTGLALVRFDVPERRASLLNAYQLPWEEAAMAVRRCRTLDYIACERFVVNARTAERGQGPAEAAMGMVGVCRLHAHVNGLSLVLETASSAKKLATDSALKKLGMHSPGMGHANDAARQAVLMAVKRAWLTGGELL